MIKSCILHFGLPKTGTTSIQQFLRNDLKDPGFCYPLFVGGGKLCPDYCHNRGLACAFYSRPEMFHANAKLGLSVESMRLEGAAFREQLRNAVQHSSAHTLLISAELLFRFPEGDLQDLIDFLLNLGLRVRAVAFVRQFKEHQESIFQQRVREPGRDGLAKPIAPSVVKLSYKNKIYKFDDLLGRSNVIVQEFNPSKFEAGCVVRHFCHTVGIKQSKIPPRTVNESLSREGLQLLYALRLHGSGYGRGWEAMNANRHLLERLSRCGGTRFFYHSSLLTKTEHEWRSDVEWAEERTGIQLLGNIYADDAKGSVRCEADLLKFSKESLDWLARESGVSFQSLKNGNPETVAQAVARLKEPVAAIPGRPSLWERFTSRVGRRFF